MTQGWMTGLMMLGLALAGTSGARERCTWPEAMPIRPLVLVGELHGTVETPALVGELACAAAADAATPVTVALEMDPTEQARIDAYLASAGTAADRSALLAGRFWTRTMQDGRSSVAMAALIERLRSLRSEGHAIQVVAVDTLRHADRDAEMAANIRRETRREGARVIALLGNRHASGHKGVQDDPGYVPAGYLLADLQPLSVRVDAPRGSAWVCAPTCGVLAFGARSSAAEPIAAGYAPIATRPGYDGVYMLPALTASPPVQTP